MHTLHALVTALFCAAIGVVLGATAIGPFDTVVALPALVAASLAVLVVFALAPALIGRWLIRVDVVRGCTNEPDQLPEHDDAEPHEPPVGV